MVAGGSSSQRQLSRSRELSAFLASVPSLKVVLEHLTYTRLAEHKAHVAWLASPSDTGDVVLEDYYGHFNTANFVALKPNVWDSNFMSTALSSGEPIATLWKTSSSPEDCYLRPEIKAVASLPMYVNSHRRYALNIGCAGTLVNARACLADLLMDVPLISLYLSYFNDRRQLLGDQFRDSQPRDNAATLTPRQFTILRLMSESMKNREIAFAIGFSESTIRMETIEIYKRLGTNGRHEAVRVANRLGLLDSEK